MVRQDDNKKEQRHYAYLFACRKMRHKKFGVVAGGRGVLSSRAMSDALDQLTEKEKETLRLIVRGHDAKSCARELDLSVHTINERLRAARRKLDVTSSREAARVLFEHEGGADNNLGYRDLGDAPGAPSSDHSSIANKGRTKALWIGGILMMLTTLAALALGLSNPGADQEPGTQIETVTLAPKDNAAKDAALSWLEIVDRNDWEASFAASGQTFQDLNTVEGWRDASLKARVPFGDVKSREALAFENVNTPPKGHSLVKFMTVFEGDVVTFETVTLEREGDGFKVVGYLIE